jgi:predicted HicB family RNase H-like nuclease
MNEEIVELELPEDVIVRLALDAHEQDITLNQHINNVLHKALQELEKK